jgi:hypothetical protein
MNCLDFRRRMLADPLSRDKDLVAHEADCPDCGPFAQELRADEIRLRGILREITPPAGLAERIQLAARFEHRSTLQRRWWLSAAATVMLVVGVSMVSLWTTSLERGQVTLAQSVLHHIEDEAHHLREAQPVAAGRVQSVFARFGAELAGEIGPVHFAAECLMRERNGVHLVLPGKMGPITVFLMPGEMTESALPVSSERFAGEILPTRWGSIAVIGESGEPLEGLGARLAKAVNWPVAVADVSDLARALVLNRVRGPQQQDS